MLGVIILWSRLISPRARFPANKPLKKVVCFRQQFLRLGGQEGFTLVEMVATIALAVALLAMSIGALSYYLQGRSLDSGAREVETQVREALALAVNSGNTYRIDFSNPDGKTYQLQVRQNGGWINARGPETLPLGVSFSPDSPPSFGGDEYLECYARGACEGGSLTLKNDLGSTRTVQVDGETANVSVH